MNITEYKLSTFGDKMNRNGFYFSTLNIQFAEPHVGRITSRVLREIVHWLLNPDASIKFLLWCFTPRLCFSWTIKHCFTKTYFMINKKFPDCPFNLPNIDIIYFLWILLRCGACFCSKSDKLFSNKWKTFMFRYQVDW